MSPAETDPPKPGEREQYARAAALEAGLVIHDQWWPAVIRHFAILLDRAASLNVDGVEWPEDPGPVFQP